MSCKPSRILMMDETQVLLRLLALADNEIEAGETVSIEEVMTEFVVETKRRELDD